MLNNGVLSVMDYENLVQVTLKNNFRIQDNTSIHLRKTPISKARRSIELAMKGKTPTVRYSRPESSHSVSKHQQTKNLLQLTGQKQLQ